MSGSYTAVPVIPMFGTRSPQTEPMAHGVPSETDQSTAPVAASSPYTQSFSVVTMTVEPTTRGWPYTDPLTGVENSWPKFPPETAAGVSVGSF